MRAHWHNRQDSLHSIIDKRARFNIQKMFTPPKSKSPWEAMTAGSTGGWAAPLNAWGPAITAATGAIPGIGPLMSTGLGAIGAAGKGSGFQGTDAGWSNLWKTPLGALQGYGLGSIGGGIGGAVKGGLSSGASGLGSGFSSGMKNYFNTNIIPGLQGSSGSGITNSIGKMFGMGGNPNTLPMYNPASGYSSAYTNSLAAKNALLSNPSFATNVNSLTGPFAAGVAGSAATNALSSSPAYTSALASNTSNLAANAEPAISLAKNTAGGSSWMDQLFKGVNPYQVGAGLGISAAGSLMGGPKNEIPQSEIFGQATSRLLGDQGLSEVGKTARSQLQGDLTKSFEPVPDAYYEASSRRMDEAYQKQIDDFAKQYKGLRPGANVENDAYLQQGTNKIRQDWAREKSALAADLDYRRENDYYTKRMQNIQMALNLDQQTFADYVSLAQMDADRLALNTGISMGEAQQFKDIFGDIGGFLMKKGMGIEDPDKTIQKMLSMQR